MKSFIGVLSITIGVLLAGVAFADGTIRLSDRQKTVRAGLDGNARASVDATQISSGGIIKTRNGRHQTVRDHSVGRAGRSTCPGCAYGTVPARGPSSPGGGAGTPFLQCRPGPNGQQVGTQLLFRTRPGTSERVFLGPVCPVTAREGAAAPVITLEMVEGEVRRFTQQVAPPAPELGFAPTGNAIVNLPVLVWATPQSTIQRDFAPFGIPVSVTLTPSWEWTFEPGASSRTAHPGQPYRDNGVPVARDPAYVTHAYRTPGARDITVTVRWAATWSLDGGPSRPLGDLTRSDSVGVTVREAPSRLVAR